MRYAALLLVVLALLLVGCQEAYTRGVALATPRGVAYLSSTPAPTVTPQARSAALPNQLDMAFMDMAASFAYPDGWEVQHGGQYILAHPPEQPMKQIGIVTLVEANSQQATPEAVADKTFLWVPNSWGDRFYTDATRVIGTALPEGDQRLAFTWGDHPAVVRRFSTDFYGTTLTKLNVVLALEDEGRFVVFWTSGEETDWDSFYAVIQPVLETATVNGEALPAQPLRAALEALAAL